MDSVNEYLPFVRLHKYKMQIQVTEAVREWKRELTILPFFHACWLRNRARISVNELNMLSWIVFIMYFMSGPRTHAVACEEVGMNASTFGKLSAYLSCSVSSPG